MSSAICVLVLPFHLRPIGDEEDGIDVEANNGEIDEDDDDDDNDGKEMSYVDEEDNAAEGEGGVDEDA
jgi:hypothetical protein